MRHDLARDSSRLPFKQSNRHVHVWLLIIDVFSQTSKESVYFGRSDPLRMKWLLSIIKWQHQVPWILKMRNVNVSAILPLLYYLRIAYMISCRHTTRKIMCNNTNTLPVPCLVVCQIVATESDRLWMKLHYFSCKNKGTCIGENLGKLSL